MTLGILSKKELIGRFSDIELLSLDTDGVLTDGGIYFSDTGEQMRKFSVKDGMGIKRVQALGIEISIISAGSTQSISHRGKTLGIEHIFLEVDDKLGCLKNLCNDLNISLDRVIYIGDDLNDLPIMEAVGFPITVADANETVLATSHFVTERRGGDGAVREVCDMIVAARSAV